MTPFRDRKKSSWLAACGLTCFFRVLFGYAIGCGWIAGLAQPEAPLRFDRISQEEGLSQATVTCILQDTKGFMWFGTQEGLNLYDGVGFTYFNNGPTPQQTLWSNTVTCLFEDRTGLIWVGTTEGLNELDPQTRIIRKVANRIPTPHTTKHEYDRISFVHEDSAGRIWVGTRSGLGRLNRETLETQAVAAPAGELKLTTMYEHEDGSLWLGVDGQGLKRFDPMTGETEDFAGVTESGFSLAEETILTIAAFSQREMLVGTRRGLFLADLETSSLENYLERGQAISGLGEVAIQTICRDEDGDFWFGTRGLGILKFNSKSQVWSHIGKSSDKTHGFNEDVVQCIYQDRGGVIWIGTMTGGLSKLNRSTPLFQNYRHQPEDPQSLSNESVSGICHDSKGRLWVGTIYGGLNRRDPGSSGFRQYKRDSQNLASLSSNGVWSILESRDGSIWVGTAGGGLSRYDSSNDGFQNWVHDEDRPDSLSNNWIWKIYEDAAGRLWVGTVNGLNLWDPKTERAVRFHTKEGKGNVHDDYNVLSILSDRQGQLWFGACDGLHRGENSDVVYRHDPADPGSISDNNVSFLHESRDGRLWVATWAGLNLLDPASGRFKRYTKENGLPNDSIHAILEDAIGNLWMSTNLGILKFDPQTERFKLYNTKDDLVGNEFSGGAAFKGPGGKLYFGALKGLTEFEPDRLRTNRRGPRVVITSFSVMNHEDPRLPGLVENHQIELGPRDQFLAFEFRALDYAEPEKNRYTYRLVGPQDVWDATDNRGRAEFSSLAPGNYRLEVQATNSDGIPSPEALAIMIRVLPPWYLSPWAYAGYVLLFALVIWLGIRTYRAKLAHERWVNEELRRADRLKDEFLANTSHELRTPLNGILGIVESLMDGVAGPLPRAATANLGMVYSSGRRLTNLVDDILDFAKLKNHSLVLRKTPVDLHIVVDIVLTLCKPLTREKDLILINNVPRDTEPVHADENRLQQILHNLVGNAIKFTPGGNVTVSAQPAGDFVKVSVVDTGIGIAAENGERIFQSFEQGDGTIQRDHGGTGLGLAISKELVALHGGEISFRSKIGEGTEFSFTLPLRRDGARPVYHHEDTLHHIRLSDLIPEPQSVRLEAKTAVKPAKPANAAEKEDSPFNILIVDDDPVNRQVLLNYLALEPCGLIEAASGEEALAAMRGEAPIDLILLDLMMPKMSGYEVCRKLRESFPVHELPIIMLTAKNQVADLVSGLEMGANDYLLKPIGKSELIARVNTHLRLLHINRNLENIVAERTHELKERHEELVTLDGIVRAINREIHLSQVLKTLLQQCLTYIPKAQKAAFLAWDSERCGFVFSACEGYDLDELARFSFTREELEARYLRDPVRLKDDIFLLRDAQAMPLLPVSEKVMPPKAMLAMAVAVNGNIEGYLIFDNFSDADAFGDADVRRLERFREHVVSALAKARIMEELKRKNDEIVRQQKQLVMQEKMASLGALTAGIAHEIRNPLNFVTNFAEVCEDLATELRREVENRQPLRDEKFATVLDDISRDLQQNTRLIGSHGQRAERIIAGMMRLAQGQPVSRQRVVINDLVEEYTQLGYHGRRLNNTGFEIRLVKDFDPLAGEAEVAPMDLGRVVINLVNNAFDALVQKRTRLGEDFQPAIRVSTSRLNGQIEIKLRDNGDGIPNQFGEKIFNPFFTTKPIGSGNVGLGLAISYDIIVQEHRGEIRVTTEEGNFTEFTIKIPDSISN